MSTPVATVANSQEVESLTESKAWKALQSNYEQIRGLHLRDIFATDPDRGERLSVEALGLFFDYSKNRITDETIALLIALAQESGLKARIDAMFRGDKINITEKRAVLHVALRAPSGGFYDPRRRRKCRSPSPLESSTAWPHSPIACAAANGKATPARPSGMSSTWVSAAPTSAPSWPTKRSSTTASATGPSASSPTSTAPILPRPSSTSTHRRPSSSSRQRPSPRSKPSPMPSPHAPGR